MNFPRMKSLVGFFLLAPLAVSLAACDGGELPHAFSGNEVPPEVMAEPRLVAVPNPGEAQGQTWMRLGDVPSMPKDFTPETQIRQSKQQMINDRTQADALRQQSDMALPESTQPQN